MPDRRPRYRWRALVVASLVGLVVVIAVVAVTSIDSGSQTRAPARAAVNKPAGGERGHAAVRRHGPAVRLHGAATRPQPRPRPIPYGIGTTELTILRPSSAASADARLPSGAPARALLTRVRYPVARGGHVGPFPLIVFSQGFDYPAEGYSGLMDAWTRAGYVVADPTFPHTDPAALGGVDENDILNHPADLRFVIGALVRAGGTNGHSRLRGTLDPSEVAVAGQSDGGDVSLAVSADSCCRDLAVKAAVILSGAELPAFGGHYYSAGAPPLLVVQGDMDTINAPGCSAALYDAAPAPKYYLDLIGAPHLPPYVEPNLWHGHVIRSVIAFLDRYLKHEPGALGRLQRAANDPGVVSLTRAPGLPGRSTYCPPSGIS